MPEGFDHIAVCIDGSDADARLLDRAVALRDALGAGTLSIVHVAPLPLAPPATDSSMLGGPGLAASMLDPTVFIEAARELVSRSTSGIPDAQGVLLEGHPAAAVCDWAAEAGADLIVAGSHRGFWERVTLGSFATQLSHHAPCSVLLVRPAPASSG